ncbi:hypothetical protein A3759_06300 [Thalassolituus sp. HI0120]|nr:hypothetical protein A3759_06300 [Thalassolituus sp. HI0120]
MEYCLKSALNSGQLKLGLPMWFMEDWRGNMLSDWQTSKTALQEYSRVFASVEGNTTFYGLPSASRVDHWLTMVPDNFRFCFKLPKDVSHSANLVEAYGKYRSQIVAFFNQLGDRLGTLLVQLPATFSPLRQPELSELLLLLQQDVFADISVELRHLQFFDKSESESKLLRSLAEVGAGRTVFDSRGLFADSAMTEAVLDARAKKPRMPVHPVATSKAPLVRFIGHSDWSQNDHYLLQWKQKLGQWLEEGRTPYFFIHTAGNTDVQHFVRYLEALWKLDGQVWPGEGGPGKTEDMFD